MKKKEKISYKKERVVISDLLPYEVPLTFSNRHFYDFLVENQVQFKKNVFTWKPGCSTVNTAVQLLLGLDVSNCSLNAEGKMVCNSSDAVTIPFAYGITHKEDELRMLSFSHPKNQVKTIDFYHRHSGAIIYYCQRSKFSLRAPVRIAKTVSWNDALKIPKINEHNDLVEESGKDYKNLKSFFVYEKYSNIFKFFESESYHRCEKIYTYMARLDISKCFDSIYTHSIAWAVFGKGPVKNVLSGAIPDGEISGSFPDDFDRLLQQENYNETNGIMIGPEVSRIFSEIILQAVDEEVLRQLREQGVVHRQDYEIFRYVDDYFLFYNDESIYKALLAQLQFTLKGYKLSLNTEKEVVYKKPIITEITIAKRMISNLFNERLRYKIATEEKEEFGESVFVKKGHIHIKKTSLITEFKSIIKSSNVEYKDVLNYSLSIVESKCKKILNEYREIQKQPSSVKSLVYAICSIVEFSFFIYSVSPRVNTTIKLCRILHVVSSFLKTREVCKDDRDGIFKVIYENIHFIINKNKIKRYVQVETLYLLVSLSQLGRDYRLEEDFLASCFGATKDEVGEYVFSNELNLFSITVALFYVKDVKRYATFRLSLENHIISKMTKDLEVLKKDAERTILTLDIMACPYVSTNLKRQILLLYGVSESDKQDAIFCLRKYWFTKWTDFDFGKELDAKRSLEVY
ncbi:antiviral reverse transcriptase Drt3b [Billgrantia aerodenitrificans]|uniref:ABC transporter ATP-binding protein n=1 Tax=Billgrantia aerodenitrificans TaxID=2733483 RepID=A0ABS9AU17_9GAMM|nr:antiviral reverse transcriptase Drt3b [Halomonas aerodenitrificans]MCE8025244.1 ABC transporter ATP-binding protein [Halomonas aerodenitrificans]